MNKKLKILLPCDEFEKWLLQYSITFLHRSNNENNKNT